MQGGKVQVLRNGIVTITVDGEAKAGETAYSHNGVVNNYQGNRIGTFLSSKDSDGFAQVSINI